MSTTPAIPMPADPLPGRAEPMTVPPLHFVNGARIVPPFPPGLELAEFALGCFWGAERRFWQQPGVYSTPPPPPPPHPHFFGSHPPPSQGNDIGTQYRSGIYTHSEEQLRLALASRDAYQQVLRAAGFVYSTVSSCAGFGLSAAPGWRVPWVRI